MTNKLDKVRLKYMSASLATRGKLVRKFGVNLFGNPKYDRLLKSKPNPPGRGKVKGRIKISEYGKGLIEKQKIRYAYGLREKQFATLFKKALSMKGVTGENFLSLLERRLDNVIFRSGVAVSRQQARQLVSHGHIQVNGHRVTIPSYRIDSGDIVSFSDKDVSKKLYSDVVLQNPVAAPGGWTAFDREKGEVTVLRLPLREDVNEPFDELTVVEYYSK
jgi:small subunit ribosomal protein S4